MEAHRSTPRRIPHLTLRGGPGIARRSPPRKVTYFDPIRPRLGRNTIIESTFDVGRRFRCAVRVDCGQIDPGAVIRPVLGNGSRMSPGTSMKRSFQIGSPAAMRSISSPR